MTFFDFIMFMLYVILRHTALVSQIIWSLLVYEDDPVTPHSRGVR